MSQHGVSIHDIRGDEDVKEGTPVLTEAGEGNCFYGLCFKRTCWKYFTLGKFKDRKHAMYCYLFTGLMIALMIAVIVPLVLLALADMMINEQVVIDSTSAPNYDAWQTNAWGDGAEHIQIKYDLYYFEVQNIADSLNGQRPKIMQVGPYSYDEYYIKFDIEWSDDGDTVTYGTQRYYIFNQESTGAGLFETDQLTLPWTTIVGFDYLLSTVTPEDQAKMDYALIHGLTEEKVKLNMGMNYLVYQIQHSNATRAQQRLAVKKVIGLNDSINMLFYGIDQFVMNSNAGDLMLKTMLCTLDATNPNGITPYWQIDPSRAWFGWLNDPLLMEVNAILDGVANKSANVSSIPWTNSVPGAAVNWTTIEDVRRRKNPDVFKTGKKNTNQCGQYVRYNNMTELLTCVVPMDSQNVSAYDDSTQFPACEHYQYEWNYSYAYSKGYRKPFATDFANRIWGTDANAFGRPITTDKLAVFISDIYRSAYLAFYSDEDWDGVTTKRFQIQPKDMQNATEYPPNEAFYNFAPSGMLNTTQAVGAPVFVSFPHFLHGDQRLVEQVYGLNPDPNVHETFIDIEPQTGLLTGAHKRLQVNYQLKDKIFPTTNENLVGYVNSLCYNTSETIQVLINQGMISANQTIPCNLTTFDALFTCWQTPVSWTFQGGEIFMPYGWVDEHFVLPNSDARDVRNSLLLIERIGIDIQFWALIAAGILFTIIVAMLYRGYLDQLKLQSEQWNSNSAVSDLKTGAWNDAEAMDSSSSGLTNPVSNPYHTGAYAAPLLQTKD